MQKFLFSAKKSFKKVVRDTFGESPSNVLMINEAVDLEKELIFIAVPKTGTTSVRSQLKQKGTPIIPNQHLDIVQVRDLFYVYLLKKTLGTNTTYPNESILDDKALRKQASEMFEACFKFSAVRNPWARAVSLYYRREGVQVKDKMTFEQFCENHFYANDTCLHPTKHKNQYDWLCDEEGKILMDYIYKVEDFETAITELDELTKGKVKLMNVQRNYNPKSLSRNYRDLYNDATRDMIAKRFEKDIDTFKYTF